MIIPQALIAKLSRLTKPTLILLASRQDARFFRYSGHSLQEIDQLHIETPHYSDHEEQFQVRSRGGTIRTGSNIERPNVLAQQEFLQQLEHKVAHLTEAKKAREIVICAPDHVKNSVFRTLPKALQKKVRGSLNAHLLKLSPLQILERISQWLEKTPKNEQLFKQGLRLTH